MARHNDVGKTGEDVACEYLKGKGWEVIERNFRRPYGEIDIVARETPKGLLAGQGMLVFVEVKTVSHATANPAENMHPQKLRRLGNTIQAYMSLKGHTGEWRLDLLSVFLDHANRTARVNHMENVVIGT